jgi:DNA-binding transcriptional MerR regulator
MKTITILARQFGLARSTLLYYDRIGLLSPSYRTHADARLYSEEDEARLERINTFRQAGIAIETIRVLLESGARKSATLLEERLRETQQQIDALRAQQRFTIELLRDQVVSHSGPGPTREDWVALLKACAFSEADMKTWHATMERDMPAIHACFLKRIGLPPDRIKRTRALSRGEWAKRAT